MKINFNYKPWLTALCLAGAMLMPSAYAAAVFELDGNVAAESAPGDDWNIIYSNTGHQAGDPAPLTQSFTPDGAPDEQFTGGGSKDELDIPKWAWRDGSPPDKNDLTNAYAAAYMDSNEHLILVFGMDRYDTSGDAQLGFWFLQGGGEALDDHTFSGKHIDGDILILSNFSNGGTVPTISVYMWKDGGVTLLNQGGQVECDGYIPSGKDFCGITNGGPVPQAWEYIAKGTSGDGDFPRGAFFEGAIDLTAMLTNSGLVNMPCFTNFLTESRSSTSITAVLKDFVADNFELCGMTVDKTCGTGTVNDYGDTNKANDSITYNITGHVTNTGFGALYDITLTDTPVGPDNPFTWNNCLAPDDPNYEVLNSTVGKLDMLPADTTACYSGTITMLISDGASNKQDQITAVANTAADGTGAVVPADDPATALCQLSVTSALSLDKTCTTEIAVGDSKVYANVNITGKVCNGGTTRIYDVQLTDRECKKICVSGILNTLLKGNWNANYRPNPRSASG